MATPPFEIRSRAELIDALSVAAQVEHLVLVEYLYAAFSCRGSIDGTVPVKVQLASWTMARELYLIAHDEMDHLGAVQQLLAALGAPPVPDVWPIPVRDGSLPFAVELTRLDAATLERFVATESPPPREEEALAATPPDPIRFDYLGDLYRAIIAGIERLGDAAFVGLGVTGTNPVPLGFEPHSVAPAANAVAALTAIVDQGEGAVTQAAGSHWGRFAAMQELLQQLGSDAGMVAFPCVRNPSVQPDQAGTTLLTAPASVAVADAANRAYRALWLLLGNTYTFDWSARDAEQARNLRRAQQFRAMSAARSIMATVVRPLGEILARLPAFEGKPAGETAGMCFEQYGEFRVPVQPDARDAVLADELQTLAADLTATAALPELAAEWAGPRLARVAASTALISQRYLGRVPRPRRDRFEPAGQTARWLSVDFSGWYQVRLATGGDPFDDPRGMSGWQFAFPGEPDLDRVIRFQPPGVHLRPHIADGVAIGVAVRAADADGAPVPALHGASVDLLDSPRFEGHNGVVAADGDEPIVPLHIQIKGGGWELRRTAADSYTEPFLEQTSLGQIGSPDSTAMRRDLGSPVVAQTDVEVHRTTAATRLTTAAAQARAGGDEDTALVLESRVALLTRPWWPFFADVGWRLRLGGADSTIEVPDGGPAVTAEGPWWLELLSTGFDPDAACALVRGVLHVPLAATDEFPTWRLDFPQAGGTAMPVDAMGVRAGR